MDPRKRLENIRLEVYLMLASWFDRLESIARTISGLGVGPWVPLICMIGRYHAAPSGHPRDEMALCSGGRCYEWCHSINRETPPISRRRTNYTAYELEGGPRPSKNPCWGQSFSNWKYIQVVWNLIKIIKNHLSNIYNLLTVLSIFLLLLCQELLVVFLIIRWCFICWTSALCIYKLYY